MPGSGDYVNPFVRKATMGTVTRCAGPAPLAEPVPMSVSLIFDGFAHSGYDFSDNRFAGS